MLDEMLVLWQCVLCNAKAGYFPISRDIGCYCCGGCGMTCLRPTEETMNPPKVGAD